MRYDRAGRPHSIGAKTPIKPVSQWSAGGASSGVVRMRAVDEGSGESPERRLLLRALRELAGFERGVYYDVPAAEAPAPLHGSPIFLHGSAAWYSYLYARRQIDRGLPAAVLALRPLSPQERLLAIDWGSTFANTFYLIEPSDAACDLTDPANAVYCALDAAARELLVTRQPEDRPEERWTAGTELGRQIRQVYGVWIYWTLAREQRRSHAVRLAVAEPDETLWERIRPLLPQRFPQALFNRAVADLYATERELFHGPATTARMPFRTRLGLPLLHDPRRVDRALRRLVNEGRASVFALEGDALVRFGGERPIPERMSDDEFGRLLL